MAKVMITGCAGLLGSHFSKYLIDHGHAVIGVDNLSGGYQDFVDPRVDFHNIDLVDLSAVETLFDQTRPDYVFHFAAYAAEGLSHWIRNFNYQNNVLASTNIVTCCVKYDVQKMIFTSSMAVYGGQPPPFTEDMELRPEDPYGIAKYAVERDLFTAWQHFDLRYSIVRPHNVIGVHQNIWDRYRNVIGIWIRKMLNDEPITIFGDGLQTRAFSDIQYYMRPFGLLIDGHDYETFNIGADREIAILDAAKILQRVGRANGIDSDIIHLEKRNEVKFAYCDQSKAKHLLNFEDKTDLEETFTRMLLWAKGQPNREVKLMDLELDNGIYSFWKQ